MLLFLLWRKCFYGHKVHTIQPEETLRSCTNTILTSFGQFPSTKRLLNHTDATNAALMWESHVLAAWAQWLSVHRPGIQIFTLSWESEMTKVAKQSFTLSVLLPTGLFLLSVISSKSHHTQIISIPGTSGIKLHVSISSSYISITDLYFIFFIFQMETYVYWSRWTVPGRCSSHKSRT